MKEDLLKEFKKKYENLNKAQKKAVDEIDGPVMVVAGPGTGKTEILTLRIGNILLKTPDTNPDSILCLTFTNSGVKEMKERLEKYIGETAKSVKVSTFHKFAYELIEKYYDFLEYKQMPTLLADEEAVFLVDEILNENDWDYISPRGNPEMYFGDLKQLVSILKRERIYAEELLSFIEEEVKNLKEDPDSISSRGESKGKLKKEVEKKIEALFRTKEVVKFYGMYEDLKKERSLMDYDDVLEQAVKLVEDFEDVKSDMKENYQYVLVDEHQDSSGVQNAFLKAIWGEVEKPNIFVVGDDRQLIYAFSGAKLSYFEEFSDIFKGAQKIILTENYRSTIPILSLADDLLKSSISEEKLNSNKKGEQKVMLYEYSYPRDEIIGAGLYFKEKIEKGVDPNECALLVPKNYNVRQAIEILSELNIPVSSGKNLSLFSDKNSTYLRRVLGIISNPLNSVLIAESLFDKTSGIPSIMAHNFLRKKSKDDLKIEDLIAEGKEEGLFENENPISKWGNKLLSFVNEFSDLPPTKVIVQVGNEILINTSTSNEELMGKAEVVRSFLHLAVMFEEKNRQTSLSSFLDYLNRLESYGTHIELAKFGNDNGIKVMTLHKSKGMQYECVWVAHMNEEIFMSSKRNGFTLPEKIKEHINKRSAEEARRELYVAITRAKEFCTISYAGENYNGSLLELASIIKDLPEIHFIKKNKEETENEILSKGVLNYISIKDKNKNNIDDDLEKLVSDNYREIKISVSMLNNFFECPWKWYFRNFLRLPEEKQVHLTLGTVAHAMIEYILKSKELPNDDDLKMKIDFEFKKEGILDKDNLRKLTKDVYEIVKDWMVNFYPKINSNYKSERSVSLIDKKNFPYLSMYGKIDLTEYVNLDEIWVTDFKTGSVKTSGQIEKMDDEGRMSGLMRQLAMYSYLLSDKDKKVTNSRLFFLEADKGDKNSLYQIYIDDEKIDLLKRDIREYDESLSNGSWINRECHFKPYGNNSRDCEYCKKAKEIFFNKK